jgi:DNA polymerase III alpha subunit
MLKDKYGQIIYSEKDLVELYLTNPDLVFSRPILSDSSIPFDQDLNIDTIPKIVKYISSDISVEAFDMMKQNNWHMPDEYKNLDIAKFVLDQCQHEEEMQRAGQELLLYQERDMFVLLKYLKYLVDTMRNNNIVWGVGRGSSVSSFVLFLIGVHKINSLYYGLEIDEFLK